MALLLRLDVDKPFGHHTLWRKVASKVKEDFYLPNWFNLGYLTHLKELLSYLNENKVPCHVYHRNCTIPDDETRLLLQRGNHHYGFHAENTKTIETFKTELTKFRLHSKDLTVRSFSKHGSGILKLGRHHFPPYEPEKYKAWSKMLNIPYPFGNGIASSISDLKPVQGWFPNHFWLESAYRNPLLNDIKTIAKIAKNKDVAVILHPCNYRSDKSVKQDLEALVYMAKNEGIIWKLIDA